MEVIINNLKSFEKKKKKIISDGAEAFHVVADFDKTLTKAFDDGNKTMTTSAVLRNYHYINEEYSKKAHELSEHYHPMEIDPNKINTGK